MLNAAVQVVHCGRVDYALALIRQERLAADHRATDHRATDGHQGALFLEALTRHLHLPEAL